MNLDYPNFLLNLKTYDGTYGEDALAYAEEVEEVADETDATFAVAPQATDLRLVAKNTSLSVVAQAADAAEPGRETGGILPEAVAEAGADGLMMNHPERRDTLADVETKIRRCEECGLDAIVCADSIEMGRAVLEYDPDCIIFENPDDIASGNALARTRPELVEEFVGIVAERNPRTKVLLGGGITTADDVARSFELGADAAGAASAAVLADDRRGWLEAIAGAF
ncbi:triose-phosphate isomerase [Halorussus lipolyticus]|uniref:triose-phosphate isomerase n=1 Tax=Halorussus lipolyticus TaxID=3034024 RepID=UPI0023E7CE0D|nr:triose-phosphate isomerase [Halorussus sp. DT80]